MSEENTQVPSTLVGTKRVRVVDADAKGRKQFVLTFGPDKNGVDLAKKLADAINELVSEGKQINFDVRIGEAESGRGKKFPTAFVLVKEMIPADQGTVKYQAKPTKQADLKNKAAQIKAEVEG